ncbi:hypothetical protein [Actinomycetospora sp. NBRC 106378]|uniref:hypothetical protein n=1 Tax=Actinomycetospora sp. NBRC 106378 TaxID=3032208 RepID=UPI0024A27C90|nr:hypothetical protein [Actinomycetospora sp. NBRC 106378]GLZ50520.1 hypothetical protein Acsp07_01370 [Actinomycetospora sp. NBRC 106378]
MTGTVATRRPDTEASGVGLSAHVREARARLEPPTVSVPAPRSAQGVVAPPVVVTGQDAPSDELLAEVDGLTRALETVEAAGDESPAHQVLCRIAALVADGVPDAGWSTREQLDVDVLRDASDAARGLQERSAKLLARLDAEERPGPAAALAPLTTALQVVVVVADLEQFERARR